MTTSPSPTLLPAAFPDWAKQLISQYESNAVSQFILHGNVADRLLIPSHDKPSLGSLPEFLLKCLLPRFDVILSYDLGHGVRVEKGGDLFSDWPYFKREQKFPQGPRLAIEFLNQYFRYAANLARLGQKSHQIGCFIRSADLIIPAGMNYSTDVSSIAMLMRDWASDGLLSDHSLATILITENINDLHPLLVNNPRVLRLKLPLPTAADLQPVLPLMLAAYPKALEQFKDNLATPAAQLSGATLASLESLLRLRAHQAQPISPDDLSNLKKELVERDCEGLIDFIEPRKTLDDLHGMEKIKAWLRQDIALWKKNDLQALPMGYLICGPVGTGKTFMVECLAGEAGVPVVKLKNFRDKWVGSTEGNLEKIFRLLAALGRCIVFVDEADQALGRRDQGANDSGVGGRVYGMLAQEMSDTRNRGRIMWVLASSRPDLIEVDLKRPGRVDVKIPLFPTTSAQEGFNLIRALCKRRAVLLEEKDFTSLAKMIPALLTPGAAEAIAVKAYRLTKVHNMSPLQALEDILADYQSPVPLDIMQSQIRLAAREASDLDFIPAQFRADAS